MNRGFMHHQQHVHRSHMNRSFQEQARQVQHQGRMPQHAAQSLREQQQKLGHAAEYFRGQRKANVKARRPWLAMDAPTTHDGADLGSPAPVREGSAFRQAFGWLLALIASFLVMGMLMDTGSGGRRQKPSRHHRVPEAVRPIR